jgi:hypothetical protein
MSCSAVALSSIPQNFIDQCVSVLVLAVSLEEHISKPSLTCTVQTVVWWRDPIEEGTLTLGGACYLR